jgi:hypothetical protein
MLDMKEAQILIHQIVWSEQILKKGEIKHGAKVNNPRLITGKPD